MVTNFLISMRNSVNNYIFLNTFFFTILYTFKQTFIGNHYSTFISFLIQLSIFSFFIILLLTTNLLTLKKYYLNNAFLVFLLLFVSTSSFFQSFHDAFAIFIKFNFAMCLLLLTIKNSSKKNILLFFTDSFLFSLILIVFLSYFNLIESSTSQTEFWTKNFSGFLNPNVPSFFIFSISSCYFIFNQKKRFLFSLAAWLLMVAIGTYSRTSSIGIVLLIIFYFLPRTTLKFRFNTLFIYFSILLFLTNVLFVFFTIFESEFVLEISRSSINSVLSNRLAKIAFDTFDHGFFWYNLKTIPFDGIHYELIFPLGFFSFVYFLIKLASYLKDNLNTPQLSRFNIGISVLILAGCFEGVFAKITPGSIILFSLLLLSPKVIGQLFYLDVE